VRIDPLSFQAAVDQAKAEVEVAEAALMKAQVTLREAADDEQRRRKLVATGAGSAVELSKSIALTMSRPMVVIACMIGSSKSWEP
jgi:multidrug resistance efflux pump